MNQSRHGSRLHSTNVFGWTMRAVATGLLVLATLTLGCDESAPLAPSAGASSTSTTLSNGTSLAAGLSSGKGAVTAKTTVGHSLAFRDVHDELGIKFAYDTGADGRALMVEATGGGAGWIDFDRDGTWDLYCVQGGNAAWKSPDENPPDQLYRGIGGRYVDVAQLAGIVDPGYGQGIAVGDFNEDGFEDIYVTNVGKNSFFVNQGDGTFVEVADVAGVQDGRWSSTAAWADLDGDSDLDLFLCNYLAYDPYQPFPCNLPDGTPTTCHPEHLNPVSNACFENLGDGTFREVAKQWGLTGPGSKSLSVLIADLDGDDRADVFVANDTTANFLFKNAGTGKYEEQAVLAGCALNGEGLYQASMGIAVGDYDENGFPDLYVTHFTHDSNTLYTNLGSKGFQDLTKRRGLHTPTLKYLGFGTVMADFDRNGKQDLFIANGHIDEETNTDSLYEMPAQLFTYGTDRFVECTAEAGPYFKQMVIGRAVASCDWDDDGDMDLAVIHQSVPSAMLENQASSGHWLKVRFIGTASNRRGISTKTVLTQGDRRLVQELVAGSSYCASNEPTLFFGLVEDTVVNLDVLWPSGRRQTLENVSVDQTVTIREPTTREASP